MADRFDAWLGKQESRTDCVAAAPLHRLAALLDHEVPPWQQNELPPLGHWLFHSTDARQSQLGADGHPQKGGFMPPIPLPRRMWAGSRIRFLKSIGIGADITRNSTIVSCDVKNAASGEMVLLTLRHEIVHEGQVAIEEHQDIVYRGKADPAQEARPRSNVEVPVAQATRRCHANAELLFRYSALTFNAHRIHYDRDYARTEEHYPGLVVQGPLLATLLVDHFLRSQPAARVTGFSFRARAPVFDAEAFDLCMARNAAGADLWVAGADGQTRMTAQIEALR